MVQTKGFYMKYILTTSLFALTLGMSGCDQSVQHPDDLPWQITASPEGNPQVFHLEVGKSTLKDVIEHFHSFPEMAVFAHESGKRTLEAYFGTLRVGLFEAKIIAELQADDATLTKFQNDATKREGMASGQWKFTLSEADVKVADSLLLKKLVYMPAVNYDPDIVTARFGLPAERLPSSRKEVEFWLYPQKGLAILLNSDGSDILYYTDPKDYPALKQDLLEAKAPQ
jgi:hypothetical protein